MPPTKRCKYTHIYSHSLHLPVHPFTSLPTHIHIFIRCKIPAAHIERMPFKCMLCSVVYKTNYKRVSNLFFFGGEVLYLCASILLLLSFEFRWNEGKMLYSISGLLLVQLRIETRIGGISPETIVFTQNIYREYCESLIWKLKLWIIFLPTE